ncbi:hypothetical protein Lalb_Chr18g0047611 [Lupinus albus]|uniref:Uncharacterized protein n=1 Tax=Lupinus albus TaxID=3870 RepID=A0A6A4P4C7_LUPAL|nr:hypothetical protein Lalb_Chr18g0047611 [Lupinus albus]
MLSILMATLMCCQYYYLLILLWFFTCITFLVDIQLMFLRRKLFLLSNIPSFYVNRLMTTSFVQCWDQFSPIIHMGLYANLPTTHMFALAFHS